MSKWNWNWELSFKFIQFRSFDLFVVLHHTSSSDCLDSKICQYYENILPTKPTLWKPLKSTLTMSSKPTSNKTFKIYANKVFNKTIKTVNNVWTNLSSTPVMQSSSISLSRASIRAATSTGRLSTEILAWLYFCWKQKNINYKITNMTNL